MVHAALAVLLATVGPARPGGALDLSPVFASGAAAAGKAAYDAGRFGEAAEKLAKVKEPEAAYVRALALVEAGRHAEAARALDGLGARLPVLADRIALLRGRALEKAGLEREALPVLAAVSDASRVAAEARLAKARLAAEIGEREIALDALGPLLLLPAPAESWRPDPGATALLLAGRLRAGGEAPDLDAARRAFLECYAAHPLSPESPDCLVSLRKLPAPHGADPGAEEVVRRAEALLEANENDLARQLLEKVTPRLASPAPGEVLACRAHSALGRAHRKERAIAKSIEALRPVVEGCDDPSVRVRALFVLAGAAAIAGDREESVALYRRVARDYPRHSYADDALFAVGDLLLRDGREAEARDALQIVAREYPGADSWDEARFKLAWLARGRGDADAAIAQLLAIEETERDEDPYEHGRAAYWRGRMLAARGDAGREAARAIWADLVARYPADYYGLLARARLAEAAGSAPDAMPPPVEAPVFVEPRWDPGPLREDPHLAAGVLLLRMGFPREAADELGAVDLGRLAAAADAVEPVLVLADLLERAGDHRSAHALLRTRARVELRKAPEGASVRAWRLAYPKAFREHVARWAPPAGVPADLLQALMREESALDPRAVSPVGAIGLTQLMLPTARDLARQLRLPRPSRADLMQGSLNVRLGARYLGQLIRRFDGSVALALAAYNAGPGAVSRWLEARGHLETDEFVEEIPYEETRGYVKRVLRSYASYRLLYGGPDPAQIGLFRVASEDGEKR
jgi:soluble lytic murein transglycosylase